MQRRDFLKNATLLTAAQAIGPAYAAAAPLFEYPRVTFYGATQHVSGSCHLLETSHGLYLIDCGRFTSDIENSEQENREFPFDPKEVRAVFLTHAHADHHGRLPRLVQKGFRGKIYCTDATRDLTTLNFSSGPKDSDDREALFSERDAQRTLSLIQAVPYNTQVQCDRMNVRYTDAGHILGSAMIECWVDGRKILFGGDIGPDDAPILHRPAQHFTADALLVESTYGPNRRRVFDPKEFGVRIAQVLQRGGDVLIPTFAVHKSQILIHTLLRLIKLGVLPEDTPIYCDSSTVHQVNRIYDAYRDYHDERTQEFAGQHGSLFFLGRYREGKVEEFLQAHGGTPSIFVSTSGMLAFAASPRHLAAMADDPRNALFIPGYQAPNSVGRRLLDGEKEVELSLQEFDRGKRRTRQVKVQAELEVDQISGFSSHASGEQILEWVSRFDALGPVFTVHGDRENAILMAEKLGQMGLDAAAPLRNQTFTIKGDRTRPGTPPVLDEPVDWTPATIDQ
jgi:metallo-beta-lactamase family protein